MVVGRSLYSQIREAYISGESQRPIAKRLGVSRPTVKKYCQGATMPSVRKKFLRAPSVVTAEVEIFIRVCLDSDQKEGLRKQTHTAKRIYDRLVEELGFTDSYSIVRRVVHEMRAQYIPLPKQTYPWNTIQVTPFRLAGVRPPFICGANGRSSKSSAADFAIAATFLSWPA